LTLHLHRYLNVQLKHFTIFRMFWIFIGYLSIVIGDLTNECMVICKEEIKQKLQRNMAKIK